MIKFNHKLINTDVLKHSLSLPQFWIAMLLNILHFSEDVLRISVVAGIVAVIIVMILQPDIYNPS